MNATHFNTNRAIDNVTVLERVAILNYIFDEMLSSSWLNIFLPSALLSVTLGAFIITFLRSLFLFQRPTSQGRIPPILPYWLPYLGSAVLFLTDGPGLCEKLVKRFGHRIPAGVRVGPLIMYFPSNPITVHQLLQPPAGLRSSASTTAPLLQRIFGMPLEVTTLYTEDDSGPFKRRFENSKVADNRRIRYADWLPANSLLLGENSLRMGERFANILDCSITRDKRIGSEWVTFPDLFVFVQDLVTPAGIESLLGRALLDQNPHFSKDLWEFTRNIPGLLHGWPRWLRPGIYKARDSLLKAIRAWHIHLREREMLRTNDSSELLDWDRDLGSKYYQVRRQAYYQLDRSCVDDKALESIDLALIFALTVNVVPAMFWMLFEVSRRRELTARVRDIISQVGYLDTRKLGKHPLLRSIFAEITRIRVVGIIPRKPDGKDFEHDGWVYPKDSMIGLSSRHGAMNKEVWNEGTDNTPHPVEDFWADRFVIYPGDRGSGPVKEHMRPTNVAEYKATSDETADKGGIFSLTGLKGVHIPFGSGPGKCPGRDFANQEAITMLTQLLHRYDIEILTCRDWKPRMDSAFFPMGTLPPYDRVPFKIKRRTDNA